MKEVEGTHRDFPGFLLMFPLIEQQEYWGIERSLTWTPAMGSSTGLTRSDVRDMYWERIIWEIEEAHKTREAEARAAKRKSKG